MEHQHIQSSSQSWALSDSLREALDTRVKSFLESLDATRASTTYSKVMNSWGVTPSSDSSSKGGVEPSAPAESAVTDPAVTEQSVATPAFDEDHSLDAQLMLAESVMTVSAEKATAQSENPKKIHSCTVDGACLRDLWLRGMVTMAGTALLFLF